MPKLSTQTILLLALVLVLFYFYPIPPSTNHIADARAAQKVLK